MKKLIFILSILIQFNSYAAKDCYSCIRPLEGGVGNIGIDLFMKNIDIWKAYVKQTQEKTLKEDDLIELENEKALANQIEEFVTTNKNQLTLEQQAKILKTHAGLAWDITGRINAFWSPSEKEEWEKKSFHSSKNAMLLEPDSPYYAYSFIYSIKATIKGAGLLAGFLEVKSGSNFQDEIKMGYEYLNRFPASRREYYEKSLREKFGN